MRPPIAEPFGTPPAAPDKRSFHLDFWSSLVGYFFFFTLTLTPILWALLSPVLTRPTSLNPLLVSLGGVVIATLLGAAVNVFYAVQVDRKTLQGFNFWWTSKRRVLWNDITGARFFWFGFPCAVVSTANQRNAVWLPLFLNDKAAFARAVEELAPAGNPLRLFLSKTRVKSVALR